MMLDPDHVAWSRNHFRVLAEDAVWGIPRSGLIFRKHGGRLELIDRMPHYPAMPVSPQQLHDLQQADYRAVKQHFEAANITVIDRTVLA